MDDLLNQIGSRILSRRKQLRMTQEELAEKAGITSQTVSSAELGKKALRPENIIRLCSALDISTDYLLLGEINENDHAYAPLLALRVKFTVRIVVQFFQYWALAFWAAVS